MTTSPNYTEHQPPADDGDDGTAAAIAAGVTVPVIIIILIAGIVYWYYRKKYPVRMIVGRDFAKFSNPAYSRRQSQPHTLVRDDADSFFQQTQPTSPVTLVFGQGDEEAKVCYVNTGFQYDSQDADEEEVERRFRQQKSYLFKKHDDQDETDLSEGNPEEDKTAGAGKRKKKSKANGQVKRDQGHDNPAFSDDSNADDEETKDTGKPSNKKEKTDSASISSDVSSASNKEGKATSPETKSLPEGPDTSPEVVLDTGPVYQEGMTVRDFLQLVREKRADSDVQRVRADTLTTFQFDIKKSARRRAQSAGDIWSSAVQALPPVSREELTLNTTSAPPPDDNVESQADSNAAREADENLTEESIKEKPTDDSGEVTQPEEQTGVEMEERERKVSASSMENSYLVVDETAADDNTETAHFAEDGSDGEQNRKDSSTSDSSYEKVAKSQISSHESLAEDAISYPEAAQKEPGEDTDLSKDQELSGTASLTVSAVCQEYDYVNVDRAGPPPSPPDLTGVSKGLEQDSVSELSGEGGISKQTEFCPENTKESSGVTVDLGDTHETSDNEDDIPALPSVPPPSSTASAVDESDTLSFETLEEFQLETQSLGDSHNETEKMSRSSSLVMLDKHEVEDPDTKDESDTGSFKTGTSSVGDKLSTEDEDFDKGSQDHRDQHAKDWEQGDEPRDSLSDQEVRTGKQSIRSVQMLPSLSYSDHSSLSSVDDDDPKKDEFVSASHQHEPRPLELGQTVLTQHDTSEDEGELTTSQQTLTPDTHLSSDSGQFLQLAGVSGDDARHPTLQGNTSPPQPPRARGLAALRLHPDVTRSSESDNDDVELTDEDIEQVLAASDDSSDDLPKPQPPPTAAPMKLLSTEKFVFSEEDDEDYDV